MWTRPVFHTGASWSLPVVDWIRVAHIKCPVFVHVKYYLLLDLFNLPEQVGHFRLLTGFMLLILNVLYLFTSSIICCYLLF